MQPQIQAGGLFLLKRRPKTIHLAIWDQREVSVFSHLCPGHFILFYRQTSQGGLCSPLLPNDEALSVFAFHFISVRGAHGETELIPHSAKMGREPQREKVRQPGNLKNKRGTPC